MQYFYTNINFRYQHLHTDLNLVQIDTLVHLILIMITLLPDKIQFIIFKYLTLPNLIHTTIYVFSTKYSQIKQFMSI